MGKVKTWLENYWYHYKWHTIIALFFAAVFAICIGQLITRTDYDVYMRYVGDAQINGTQYNDMLAYMEKGDFDINDDGKVNVNFAQVPYVSDDENPYKNEINADARETLTAMIVQRYYIYLMDVQAYEVYKGEGIYAQLTQVYGDKDVSDIAYDECAVYFNKTEFYKNAPGMEWVDDDVVMILKTAPYRSIITKTKYRAEVKAYEEHKEIFIQMVGK